MKVFLIIVAVLVVLTALILSISAEFTIIFDNGWTTKIRVLFIEKDIELTKLLSFLVAPDKAGREAAEKSKSKKKRGKSDSEAETEAKPETVSAKKSASESEAENAAEEAEQSIEAEGSSTDLSVTSPEIKEITDDQKEKKAKAEKPEKLNPIQKILKEDGIVGIMLLVSNLLQTVNSAITTLIKGLHIYSLYVKMIVGGGDAATIGEKFGSICGWYYPMKGVILNQMKVDNYDDLIMPDFIAPRSEYELQFIGSLSVGLLVKVGLKAGKVFLVNFIKNR